MVQLLYGEHEPSPATLDSVTFDQILKEVAVIHWYPIVLHLSHTK